MMQKKIEAYIREWNMLTNGDKVIVAVSGGADSVCLFHILLSLKERYSLGLRAVHVHHGLRGEEADRDARFVETFCRDVSIPCKVVWVNASSYGKEHGLTVEEAGRELRYGILEQEAGVWGAAKIAVAHHQEDQAETILHHLFRGSGLKGLSGIPPVRGAVIRPLLCVGKKEILAYLEERHLEYCEDSTNFSTDYTRNRLRLYLIPEICAAVNEEAVEHIVQAGEKAACADRYFEQEAERIWREHGLEEPPRCGIETVVFQAQPEILKSYVVMQMVRRQTGSLKDVTSRHVNQICALADKRTGSSISLPCGLTAWKEYGKLWVGKGVSLENGPTEQVYSLVMTQFSYEKQKKIPENRYTKWFDYDKIKGTLSVRTRKTGDYITLKGGKRKTVKAYMIDEKIPRQERDRIMLLAEGDHILWIVGYRISEYYKVTETTRQILQVQADGGREHGRENSGADPGERGKQAN